jgi:hypothetical protein
MRNGISIPSEWRVVQSVTVDSFLSLPNMRKKNCVVYRGRQLQNLHLDIWCFKNSMSAPDPAFLLPVMITLQQQVCSQLRKQGKPISARHKISSNLEMWFLTRFPISMTNSHKVTTNEVFILTLLSFLWCGVWSPVVPLHTFTLTNPYIPTLFWHLHLNLAQDLPLFSPYSH